MTRYLNLGCGAVRPPEPWVNIDSLFEYLSLNGLFDRAGAPEAMESIRQLRSETNYLNLDITKGELPFANGGVDGIVANHVLEHMDCREAVRLLRECRRVLRRSCVIRVGVPDATVFRHNYARDARENTVELYGEPLGKYQDTFMQCALLFGEHKQVLTEDALWCLMTYAGFLSIVRKRFGETSCDPLASLDNREKFTVFMEGVK
jgi:predicted SAM-dependent methyltransferase